MTCAYGCMQAFSVDFCTSIPLGVSFPETHYASPNIQSSKVLTVQPFALHTGDRGGCQEEDLEAGPPPACNLCAVYTHWYWRCRITQGNPPAYPASHSPPDFVFSQPSGVRLTLRINSVSRARSGSSFYNKSWDPVFPLSSSVWCPYVYYPKKI